MSRSSVFRAVAHCFRTLSLVVFDLVRLAFLAAHSRSVLVADCDPAALGGIEHPLRNLEDREPAVVIGSTLGIRAGRSEAAPLVRGRAVHAKGGMDIEPHEHH